MGTTTTPPISDCRSCPIGKAAGVERGFRCPLSGRPRPAGTYVYIEGQVADRVWFVKRGNLILIRESGDGSSGEGVAWGVRRPGSFLGIECLTQERYLDTAKAITDVILCSALRDDFDRWLGAPGSSARVVLDLVLRTQCNDHPRRASCDGNAVCRTARWLLEEPMATADGQLPRRYVAQLLGMLPETFSRALATLASHGAIEVTRKRIQILDRNCLEALATRPNGG